TCNVTKASGILHCRASSLAAPATAALSVSDASSMSDTATICSPAASGWFLCTNPSAPTTRPPQMRPPMAITTIRRQGPGGLAEPPPGEAGSPLGGRTAASVLPPSDWPAEANGAASFMIVSPHGARGMLVHQQSRAKHWLPATAANTTDPWV